MVFGLLLVAALSLPGRAAFTNSTAPAFDLATSYRFLFYAYASYSAPSPGDKWTCPYCTNYTQGFIQVAACENKTHGSYAFVGYHNKFREIIVSFRGSSDIPNWLEDFDVVKTRRGEAFPSYPSVQVEAGFFDYWMSLSSCVLTTLVNLQKTFPTYQTFMTGHSLGAAGSVLAALDAMVNLGMSVSNVYTFGSPRIGNAEFAQLSAQELSGLQRMVNNKDCVAHVPWQDMGFRHETTEIFETPSGGNSYKICSSTNGEDNSCSNQFFIDDCNDHLFYMGVPCCDGPDVPHAQLGLRSNRPSPDSAFFVPQDKDFSKDWRQDHKPFTEVDLA